MEREFRELIWQKARELYRDMPWREDTRPYYVLVSELMLQQTQVSRVIPKFNEFIVQFPDVKSLAAAPLAQVLRAWQGLGYNRRAKFLHQAAAWIMNEYQGNFPESYETLLQLPGVGKNTAGAILAYSFNHPSVFIETNIRTVYIHHFFADDIEVTDAAITEKLKQTLDAEHPREFYWALMDYGSWLKAHGIKNISMSKHYKKQTPLKGSLREMRGMILRMLSENQADYRALKTRLPHDERFEKALTSLQQEGLIERSGEIIHLTKH